MNTKARSASEEIIRPAIFIVDGRGFFLPFRFYAQNNDDA